jgi:ribosome biogenesis GTPase
MNKHGKIIKIISNLYTVKTDDGLVYECRARGKFRNDLITPLVGEFVVIDSENAYIKEVLPRCNELKRPPIANVDAALIITSVKEPDLSLNLLDKELLCVLNEGIEPIIVLTKCDLLTKDEKSEIKKTFKYYKKIGFKVLTNKNLFRLKRLIKDKIVVLTGQTGAGKSTLLNKLDKSLNLNTSPISKALGRGVHTTRHVELFEVAKSFIADTPGFSALDLHMDKDNIKNLYPEFKDAVCKFDNCNHINENKCGVKDKVAAGEILKSRYDNYVKFRGEL